MNDVSEGKEPVPIPLEVDSDQLELLGKTFHRYESGIVLPSGISNMVYDDEQGCNCKNDCTRSECDCVSKSGYFYDSSGLLNFDAIPKFHPLYECSKYCSCSYKTCLNRTCQKGVNVPLVVKPTLPYETRNSQELQVLHLGVVSKSFIKKGTFVCLFAGEIISSKDAHQRWNEYRSKGDYSNYALVIRENVFDQGESEGHETIRTIVDPRHIGNVSRFINHACPPLFNLIILPVRPFNSLVPLPAMFASRDINEGEELRFDYMPDMTTSTVQSLQKCHCGSKQCRGWIPFDPSAC